MEIDTNLLKIFSRFYHPFISKFAISYNSFIHSFDYEDKLMFDIFIKEFNIDFYSPINDSYSSLIHSRDYKNNEKFMFYLRYVNMLKNKKLRVKKRVDYILTSFEYCYFITLTINPKFYNEDYKIWYRRIKELFNGTCFIFNTDYGTTGTERLHFHGVIGTFSSSIDDIIWKYGYYDYEKIGNRNLHKLTNYVTKLTRHAIKVNSNKFRLLYSRLKK